MPDLRRQDEVHLLDLGDDENRLSLDWMKSVSALLDEVSKQPAPRARVTVERRADRGYYCFPEVDIASCSPLEWPRSSRPS
jgi:hypothetical protein